MDVLALADDMTGALETGAQFSAQGIPALVATTPVTERLPGVVVLDTETRHLSAAEASRKLTCFVRESAVGIPRLIYKKTDSTLRGNIRAELLAVTALYPQWTVGYAPAYPALGRTVRKGRLFVNGVAVCDTEFARDSLNPVLTSSVTEMLGPECRARVFDGERPEDIEGAARAILADAAMRIAVGPAALAEYLARLIDVGLLGMARGLAPALPAVNSCVVVNGSRHSASRTQIERALNEAALSSDAAAPWTLVRNEQLDDRDATAVARENAQAALQRVRAADSDAVFVIGGDTAFAFIQALGLPVLFPIREIVAGVAVSRIPAEDLQATLPGRKRHLLLISKAGGFGAADLFTAIRERLPFHVC